MNNERIIELISKPEYFTYRSERLRLWEKRKSENTPWNEYVTNVRIAVKAFQDSTFTIQEIEEEKAMKNVWEKTT